MTDKEKTEMLTAVLETLLGPLQAGTFVVEVKANVTVDAANNKEAQEKALAQVKEHPEMLKTWAIKVNDLIHRD